MKKITLSLSYYNDYQHLNKHFEQWIKYKDLVKFQIIDDGSEEDLAFKLQNTNLSMIDLSIYRINKDIKWNIPGVRNLGATICETEWILFCDMDQFFLPVDMNKIDKFIRNDNVDSNKFYSFSRIDRGKTMGTMLLTKRNFWKCGGYDEDLIGNYGYNDPLLRKQLESVGISEHTFDDIFCQQFNADCKLERNGIKKNKKKMERKIKKLPRKNLNILNFQWEKRY